MNLFYYVLITTPKYDIAVLPEKIFKFVHKNHWN